MCAQSAKVVEQSDRPWGSFRTLAMNERCTVKVITVQPAQALSLQYHEHRDELWIVLDDGIEVTVGDTVTRAATGDEFFVPRSVMHRLRSLSDEPVRVLEVAFGDFNEDDITRIEDCYGRV